MKVMSRNSNSSNGLGLGTILAIVFTVLKLTGFIDWSWWWVLSPLWIPLILISFVLLVLLIFFKKN